MHECCSGSALLVNAEVDSMGGVVNAGVGIGVKTSSRIASIEKAQAELRQEFDVRDERRRQLDFLEKGGNPLDFKLANLASVSIQSTSLKDQCAKNLATSEAKGSFALTTSHHGDSVESSGRPRVTTICEPNSADNLLLFDGENEPVEVERKTKHPGGRTNVGPLEQSSKMHGTKNAKEAEDSAIFRPYARRNRSRPSRDGARSSSTDMVQSSSGHGLPARGTRLVSESNNQKNPNTNLVPNSKHATSNGDVASRSSNNSSSKLDGVHGVHAVEATAKQGKGSGPDSSVKATSFISLRDKQKDQPSEVHAKQFQDSIAAEEPDLVGGSESVIAVDPVFPPCPSASKDANETGNLPMNEYGDLGVVTKNMANGTKLLDSESSCTQNSKGVEANNENEVCINRVTMDANGFYKEKKQECQSTHKLNDCGMALRKNEKEVVDSSGVLNDDGRSLYKDKAEIDSFVKVEEESLSSKLDQKNQTKHPLSMEAMQENDHCISEIDVKAGILLDDESSRSADCNVHLSSVGCSGNEILGTSFGFAPAHQKPPTISLKLADKDHEDSILEEARIIQAKRKRIAELSIETLTSETRGKSSWDFVLEEMAWLANDFAQERLWKITAAAQICHRVAFSSRIRSQERHQCWKHKKIAHTIAKAVMQFWHSAEALFSSDVPINYKDDLGMSTKVDGGESFTHKLDENHDSSIYGGDEKGTSKELQLQHSRKTRAFSVQGYAVRFLKYSSSHVPSLRELPESPCTISDVDIMDMSWDDHLTEESLFYAVPSGAMEVYKKLIESHVVQCEKTGSSLQEEVETSIYDRVAEFGYPESTYDEDEGATSAYYLPGALESNMLSKSVHKKQKKVTNSYNARSSAAGAHFSYRNDTVGSQPSILLGKRPGNNLNIGSIPTKRMRTAPRQRVVSPFGAGATGALHLSMKTDASSGETSSFQDDQSTLHGGSHCQKSMEVESVGEFEKQLPYDHAETSAKSKKKKKTKNPGSAFERGWQMDSSVHNEPRDFSKRRIDSHHADANGMGGLYGQPNTKKLKMMKNPLDCTFDSITAMAGSTPSPVASQMSNMPNSNKFIKLIGGRDKGRKAKTLKILAGQPGSGNPWSLFEDQALVVLVHDMGPNWELVSDAINSTLQFKCIFREPKECKERHNILMDKSTGDGGDSPEDSGSSQSYPSTLPGIPKGSARQLFQRLQGPMEENTIKSHFERIIMIGKKHHYLKSENDNLEAKQIAVAHNSHVISLSHATPNNLNGIVLTPFQLCDVSSSDVLSLGYQNSHVSASPVSTQGAMASVLPTSGANSSLQGSPGVVIGGHLPSSSSQQNASSRDGRYGIPYNHMLAARSVHQSNLSVSGALPGTDRGVRMIPGGNGMGMPCGINRSISMPMPGFQGLVSSSMLSSSVAGMPSMHSGAGSGQGNTMLRPREALHMMRPAHNAEHPRQMMVPDLQMQVSQGNNALNGLNPSFSSQQHQMSPKQSHVLSNLHNSQVQGAAHPIGSQQQAYAIRLAKERQMQQRLVQQQQHATSSALMPHTQPQNSTQVQSQLPTTPTSPMTPTTFPHQQRPIIPPRGLNRNPPSGLNNQMAKQRQRHPQQFQQTGGAHPQQRQNMQLQQQNKNLKGPGRGNMPLHQNVTVDSSHLNGLSVEKGEQTAHLIQSSNHSLPHQKIFTGPASPQSSQVQQMPSHSDSSSPGQALPVGSGQALSNTNQGKPQPRQKQFNQSQPSPLRILQLRAGSETPDNSQVDLASADQPPKISCKTSSHASMDSTNVVPLVPSAVASQWKPPESSYDSVMPNPANQVGSIGIQRLPDSDENDLYPSVSQEESVDKQLLSGLPSHRHNSGQLHRQQSPTSQQQYQPQGQQKQKQQENKQSDL